MRSSGVINEQTKAGRGIREGENGHWPHISQTDSLFHFGEILISPKPIISSTGSQKQMQNLKGKFCIQIGIAGFKQMNEQTRWLKHESEGVKSNSKPHTLGWWEKTKIETLF